MGSAFSTKGRGIISIIIIIFGNNNNYHRWAWVGLFGLLDSGFMGAGWLGKSPFYGLGPGGFLNGMGWDGNIG
jgi:ABC-type uncharacterized transport system permease subunit